MTRETKVGLIVATSFLLLVGSVVFYKLYMVGSPTPDAGDDAVAEADDQTNAGQSPQKLIPLDTKAPPAPPHDTKPGSAVASENTSTPKEDAAPPPEDPVLTGAKDSRPPPLPSNLDTKPSVATRPEAPSGRPMDSTGSGGGLTLGSGERPALRPDASPPPPPETKDAPPPPPDTDGPPQGQTSVERSRASFDTKAPPPEARSTPSEREARPALEEKRPTASPGGRPPLELPMRPESKPMPYGSTESQESHNTAGPAGSPPAPPPEAPTHERRPSAPERPMEVVRPSTAGDTPVPLSLPPEARTAPDAGKKPIGSLPPEDSAFPPRPKTPAGSGGSLPAANAFDRSYEPPAHLGKPSIDPGQAGRPVPPDDGKRGTPVEIREQPEISAGPLPSAVRRSGNVTIYDDIRYPVRPNDTYASISQLKYGSDRYAEALAAYNRERNPRAAKPLPGMNVLIPPVEILERDYRNVIASGSPGSGPESPPAVPPAPPFRRDASPEVRMEPTRPAATARAGEKTYRVRTGDTLWNISKQTLGNGERWVEILRINRDVLPDINRLQDGLILRLPADAKVDTGARPQ